MSIFRRVSFLGLALASLVVLAACGGDGDGARVELPAPGEYFIDVEANIEFTLTQPEVSAAAVGEVQVYSGQGMGSTGITISTPGGGEQIIGSFGGMQITVDINPGDDGFQIRISQQPDEESTLSEMTEQEGTLGALFIEFEIPADRIPGDREGTATLMNADPLLLGSLRVLDVTEPFSLQGPDGYGPVPLTDDAGQTVGEITAFDLTLNPIDGLVADGADVEPQPEDEAELPTDTEEQGSERKDPKDDATDCATGESVDDPAVDIDEVNVRKVGDDIEVEVVPVQSPTKSFKDYSNAIILFLFGWEGLAEFHAGLMRQGQTDSNGDVIPGTEDAMEVTDDAVTFTVTDGGSIPEGSLLEVRAFHTEAEGGDVNCDTFMDELSLSELQSVPCGGECTREE